MRFNLHIRGLNIFYHSQNDPYLVQREFVFYLFNILKCLLWGIEEFSIEKISYLEKNNVLYLGCLSIYHFSTLKINKILHVNW